MEQRAVVPLLSLKGLKAKEIEMELTSIFRDEALLISAVKKWRRRFLRKRTELGDELPSRSPINSGLIHVIIDLIRERPFLSCKILCRHLRVSKERCLRILHEEFGLKKFDHRWISHALTPEHGSLKSCQVTSTY
jgi:hypothetical protein